jgi:hypothetical protein
MLPFGNCCPRDDRHRSVRVARRIFPDPVPESHLQSSGRPVFRRRARHRQQGCRYRSSSLDVEERDVTRDLIGSKRSSKAGSRTIVAPVRRKRNQTSSAKPKRLVRASTMNIGDTRRRQERSVAAVARMTIPPAYCFTFGANEHAANRIALNCSLPATSRRRTVFC